MKSVVWFIPTLIEGSGGHRTMLQNALELAKRGYRIILHLEDSRSLRPGEDGVTAIRRLFSYEFDDVRIGWHDVQPADAAVATIWYSAKIVRDLPFPCRRLYLVQDWEACFNPMGDTYLFAENSYRYGLTPITIGRWLPNELMSRFGVPALHFDFCADTSIYHPLGNVDRERAIAFIYQPEKPRRGGQIGVEALGIVKYHLPDVKILLYGSRDKGAIWYPHDHLGLLSQEECNALYNRVQVGLCISSSNPSRIPFEMMASGLPVVELHRGNTVHDLPEDACELCDQSPESLAEGLIGLLNAPERLARMRTAARQFMADRTIELGYDQFIAAFERAMVGPLHPDSVPELPVMYRRPPVVASTFVSSLPQQIRQNVEASRSPRLDPMTRLRKWSKRKLVSALS